MESIKQIFKIGNSPSSSHTMAPGGSVGFASRNPQAASFSVTLYESGGYGKDIIQTNRLRAFAKKLKSCGITRRC